MVNFGPLAAEIYWQVWAPQQISTGFALRVLAALLHGTVVVGVRQTAALNRGRHLYLPGRPSRWALAYISSLFCFMFVCLFVLCYLLRWIKLFNYFRTCCIIVDQAMPLLFLLCSRILLSVTNWRCSTQLLLQMFVALVLLHNAGHVLGTLSQFFESKL